jgi:hypothetical protein
VVGGEADEGGEFLGQRGEGEVVYEPVALVIPSVSGEGKQERGGDREQAAWVLHAPRLRAGTVERN